MLFLSVASAHSNNIAAYFVPNNPVAQVTAWAILILFIAWICFLILSIYKIVRARMTMRAMSNVSYLTKKAPPDGHNAADSDQPNPSFYHYCKLVGVKRENPVAVHVASIYEAGRGEGRLEVEALIGYTERRIMPWTGFLKSILSSFIVIGLLGTLLGLADSMAKLKPVFDQSISQASNERVSQALGELLIELRSAFAPSIDGVLATVVGLLIFSLYLRFLCGPVKQELERMTRTVWVNQLYPAVPQKLMEKLVEASGKLDKAMGSSEKVITLVSDVQEDMDDFSKRLKDARGVTKDLIDSVHSFSGVTQLFNKTFVTQLASFSDRFQMDVSKLSSFQNEIQTLYSGVAQDSEIFRNSVTATLKPIADQQNVLLHALKCYEQAYEAQRGEMENSVKKFIDTAHAFTLEATRANTSINQTNVEMLQKVQEGLNQQLQAIRNELVEVAQVLRNIGNPMENSAEKIIRTHETFTSFMDNRLREFLEMTADLNVQLSELNRLPESSDRIADSLAEFAGAVKNMPELPTHTSRPDPVEPEPAPPTVSIPSIPHTDEKSLETAINSLSSNISELNKSLHATENHPQHIEPILKELLEAIKRLERCPLRKSWGGYSIT